MIIKKEQERVQAIDSEQVGYGDPGYIDKDGKLRKSEPDKLKWIHIINNQKSDK